MVQREFKDPVGAKTVRFSHGNFGLVVQTLHNPAGNKLLSAEVIQDQFPMLTQRAGNLCHRLDARAHGLPAPLIEKPARPRRRVIIPELLKGFLEKVGADGFQIVAEEIAQPEMLFGAEVVTAAKQQPASLSEHNIAALPL